MGSVPAAAAVKEQDLLTVSTSLDNVLNDTQQFLSFPTDTDGTTSVSASTGLAYEFHGALSTTLQTSWEIIPGLLLDSVSLDINVDMYSSSM